MSESAKHTLMGGKLHVYKRENSEVWQCSTYLGGKNRRISTKETSLAKAKDFAEDWYLELFGKHRRGEIKDEKTFKHAADQFLREYEIITEGHRNKEYVKGHSRRLKAHLIPFFGEMGLSEITAGQLQEYRIHRLEKGTARWGKPPARNTIHQEIVTLRQTLKVALRHNWLNHLPDFSEPYRSSGKISHRAWFSPEEYKTLYEATRQRAKSPLRNRYKWESEQLHDYVLFMANTGLRPDEAMRLEYRDVVIVDDAGTGDTILEISVRGKRGVGYCKSMPGAVKPFERLVKRNNPQKTDTLRDLTEKTLSREERVSMIGTLESFHSLSRIINRTRRRDVGSFCTRRPETVEIAFTPDQQEIHDQLLDFEAKALSTLHGQQNVKFMMSTIRRQTASCIFGLAPFIKDILERRLSDLDWSEIGEYEETGQIDDFISELRSQAESIAAKARTLPEDDPKFDALADVIAQKQRQDNNKVIIFSSFRHTLSYLERKLKEAGIRLAVIHGGVKDEDRVFLREKFELPKENADAIDVMLFSEVGCEGLDYQFCDMMINYDLPWNPMKIEQRIGRIDRRGQKSEAVSIFNFITPGTVDADIYIRCLQRIGIFESSIGDCESILGDVSQEIKNIGESVELTPEERQKKLEQLADNEIRQIQEQRKLEDKEFELFGIRVPQGQIEAEVQKADSYWLRPSSLQKFIESYLTKRLGKGDYILGETPLKTLRVSQEARQILLDDFLKLPKKKSPTHQSWHTWLKGGDQHLSITFDSATATNQRNATFLTPVHPLILQAASFMEMAEPVYIAMKISNQGVPTGDYPFAIYAWEFRGLRSELQMVPVCSNEILQKDLTDYLESGASVEISESMFNDDIFGNLDKDHHKLWDIKKKSHAAQTREMCAYRCESLKTSHTGRISILTRQLEKANNDNIRRMKQAQISNVQADFEKKMKLIEIAENGADIHARPVVFGILRVEH